MTRCPSTERWTRARVSAWSMWLAPRHHGVDQGEHLAAGQGTPDTARQIERGIDEALEAEAGDQGRHQQQAGVGHQVRLVEGHTMRSILRDTGVTESASSVAGGGGRFERRNSPKQGGTFHGCAAVLRSLIGGSRLSRGIPGPGSRAGLRHFGTSRSRCCLAQPVWAAVNSSTSLNQSSAYWGRTGYLTR